MKEYIIAGDIGKKQDNFALLVMRDNPQIIDGNKALQRPDRIVHHYDIVHVEQKKGMRYEQMVDRFVSVAGHSEISNNYDLLVDGTMIGDAVVEMLRQKRLMPIPIIFTGGEQVHEVSEQVGNIFGNVQGSLAVMHTIREIHVPKVVMKDAAVLLFQQGRLHFAKGLPLREEVEKQLIKFKGKVNERTGHVKYEAEKEETHDDITVCFLMACWWALHGRKDGKIKERTLPDDFDAQSLSYEPADYD